MSLLRPTRPSLPGDLSPALRAARRQFYREMFVSSDPSEVRAGAAYLARVGQLFSALSLLQRAHRLEVEDRLHGEQRETLELALRAP